MSGMKNRVMCAVWLCAFLFAVTTPVASHAAGQGASIEFVARATPSQGLDEPVRGFPFYLLSKSFVEIGKESAATYPKPDMDAFIAKQDGSPELKAWMKKNQWVMLSGEEFTHKLKADDILGVPEFKKAYMDRNLGDRSQDFPKLKAKPSDMKKDPAKFEKLSKEYIDAIHAYIEAHPETVDGIDLGLAQIDPSPKWIAIQSTRTAAIRRRTLDLAQSTYLVARTETDLQGQGFVRGLAPGTYWISTLDVPPTVGDARPQWDVPVVVRAGQTEYVTLSNSNSVRLQASQ
jgi:hypothetical protein